MAYHIPLNNAPYAALIDYKEFVNLFQIRENYSHNPSMNYAYMYIIYLKTF